MYGNLSIIIFIDLLPVTCLLCKQASRIILEFRIYYMEGIAFYTCFNINWLYSNCLLKCLSLVFG